jgi:hypothetical protein
MTILIIESFGGVFTSNSLVSLMLYVFIFIIFFNALLVPYKGFIGRIEIFEFFYSIFFKKIG